jgi:SAM-dependent methyltransferase
MNRKERRAALKRGSRMPAPASVSPRAGSGGNAAYHFNLATSHQAAARWDKARAHFTRAIALGMDDTSAVQSVLQMPVIAGCLHRIAAGWPRPLTASELCGPGGVAAIAAQALLICLLKLVWLCQPGLEHFLTRLRALMLERAGGRANVDRKELALYSALAQQCFINEYVFAPADDEIRQAIGLQENLSERLAKNEEISSLLITAVAAYFPLHRLAKVELLLNRKWPGEVDDLLRQQIREPLEELRDRGAIPTLTAIDDRSLPVQQQYEDNPYPRWIVIPPVAMPVTTPDTQQKKIDILIAGCGTGQHSIDAALLFPHAQILAVDISLTSLAYARRKTREAGLNSIDYAHADILKLGTLDRRFDFIEAVGVLHHLADPAAGWRVLLSLLRPGGSMRVGLYSEAARRAVIAGRTLIARRGYPPTAEGIRACRQEIFHIKDGIEKSLITLKDFYSTSGCRDLLFNVLEHRYTLQQIKVFLAEHRLLFLGFELPPETLATFRQRYSAPAALTDLDHWQEFEAANPDTFLGMYIFRVGVH